MNNLIRKIKEYFGWWEKNYGFAGSGRRADDYVFGADTPIIEDVLVEHGQWDNYLPEYEYQNTNFETMACVTFSALNCQEIILKRKYNETWDFSDRFTAKMSGTTYQGNSMWKVIESIRSVDGLISQGDFAPMYPNGGKTWAEFYREIPQETKDIANDNLNQLQIRYEWVRPSTEDIKEALKYSPLQIAIYAYGKKVNGVYQRITGHFPNHCVTLYGWDENGNWKIFDHYLGNEKRLLAPDYIIGYAMKFDIQR